MRRLWCWIFACRYEEEIGGGWCQRCQSDIGYGQEEIYWQPVWVRRKKK